MLSIRMGGSPEIGEPIWSVTDLASTDNVERESHDAQRSTKSSRYRGRYPRMRKKAPSNAWVWTQEALGMLKRLSSSIVNIVINFGNRWYRPEIVRKAKMRLLKRSIDSRARERSEKWCQERAGDFGVTANTLDAELWRETMSFSETLAADARKVLSQFDVDLGGGGFYPLLYFLTRYLKPTVVVETGVAAGFSSKAILAAMKINDRGRLYSSDFPYFRLANPEKFIGVLVDRELRSLWSLRLLGDRKNIPEILGEVTAIDLFHYDSDKTYAGREYALQAIESALSPSSVVVMDDIQDNLFFRDYVLRRGLDFKVFSFEGKFIGVTGL